MTYDEALARSPIAAGSASASGSAGRGRCSASSATRSSRSAARSSPGPTARAACSPSPGAPSGRPGYRVGETPKPHLVTYRERIVVDGQPIDAGDFARLVAEVAAGRPTASPAASATRPSSSC